MFSEDLHPEGLSRMKWEYEKERTGFDDIIALGTADMDFQSPEPILDAIRRVADRGHLGYPYTPDRYYRAIHDYLLRASGWDVDVRSCTLHNVGIYMSAYCFLDAMLEKGDEVVIFTPVHFWFRKMVEINGYKAICIPLVSEDGVFHMDKEAFEKSITPRTKMVWICNPHNPVGRAWSREELSGIADIALRHGLWILSDDVYCGLLNEGTRYTPIASLSKEVSDISFTMYSTSKSYNTTGLRYSFVITENPELLSRYRASMLKLDLTYGVNLIGIESTIAAYNECDQWLAELMRYIRGNYEYASSFIAANMPEIKAAKADSTYFMWLDIRAMGLDEDKVSEIFLNEGHIILENGKELGPGGEGHVRLNIATKRENLEIAMERFQKIYRKCIS